MDRMQTQMGRSATILAAGIAGILPASGCGARPRVQTGIDVLIAQDFAPLSGMRVGLITNPTGVTRDLRSTVDVLFTAPEVKLVALFGPEHGVRGDAPGGAPVGDARDPATGLPVYSLYGPTRKPTPEMLKDIDVLVYDIQDVGSRSYTFISTLASAMEAAAESGKRFVVLDRPNPLTGNRVEGLPLDMKFQSFVGYVPIPYVYGLTCGELARMINGEGWLPGGARCDLTVVPLRGWRRAMWFDQTGLTWVPTSPHVPRADSALFYAATGIMGELQVISEGVGYTLPFELAGAPWIDGAALATNLNARRLPGVWFRAMHFQPFYAHYSQKPCGGVQVHITDRQRVDLTAIQFHIMDAVRALYPEQRLFGGSRDAMFDKVCGTDEIRRMFEAGEHVDAIVRYWNRGRAVFRTKRTAYLMYR
ncbi:MAG TPA: DUF1343 domain-containing protein [Phycisphaerae bacterium]